MPPNVNAGRTIIGNPISFAKYFACSTQETTLLSKTGSEILIIKFLNNSLSSACFTDSILVPKISTLNFFKIPVLSRLTSKLSPVCPPTVAIMPFGLSFSIIRLKDSTVKGSIYTLSAIFSSVIIVAGLELTSTTLIFSPFNALQA